MSLGVELLREHKYRDLWQNYCGFIDLSLHDFMLIQQHLLLEQLELLKGCELGRYVMQGARPGTVEEFREQAPLTTYGDYAPYLLEQREDVLPAKPFLWQHTSGLSGEQYKWAPTSERVYQEMGKVFWAVLIFATSKRRGDISFGEHEKMLYALAPPPYTTGSWGRRASEELPLDFLPPLEEAEAIPFEDRLKEGLQLGLAQGMDLVFGLPSLLLTLGERISQRSQGQSLLPLLRRPRVLARVVKAVIKNKLARRPLLPKDLWSLRGIAIAGSNVAIYRDRIKEMWGQYPLDMYGCTEGAILAMQTWDREGMTFVPYFNFLEFIPEGERFKAELNPGYQPRTLLLDEVRAGERYEIVITNLLGGPFVRYRLGDLVRITALRNEQLDIDLPQMVFYSRVADMIELGSTTHITEKMVWQAISQAGVRHQEWTVRKEGLDTPFLHLYLELREEGQGERRGSGIRYPPAAQGGGTRLRRAGVHPGREAPGGDSPAQGHVCSVYRPPAGRRVGPVPPEAPPHESHRRRPQPPPAGVPRTCRGGCGSNVLREPGSHLTQPWQTTAGQGCSFWVMNISRKDS